VQKKKQLLHFCWEEVLWVENATKIAKSETRIEQTKKGIAQFTKSKVEIEQSEVMGENNKVKCNNDASHTLTFTPLQHSRVRATSNMKINSDPNLTSKNGDVKTWDLLLQYAQYRPPWPQPCIKDPTRCYLKSFAPDTGSHKCACPTPQLWSHRNNMDHTQIERLQTNSHTHP
jgi:hypothetical protein